jgi:hypothetical protein
MAITHPTATNPMLRKIPKIKTMDEAIKPSKFQRVVFIKQLS